MWCSDRRGLLRALAALPVAACGFTPLYAPDTPAAAMIGRIDVVPLDGMAGFTLRERLVERLGPADAPTHLLIVSLDLTRTGVALTDENITTRYNVVGTADFALTPIGGGPPVLTDEVRAITDFSAPDTQTASAFASSVAERDAGTRLARTLADRIVQRLALRAEDWEA